MKEIKIEIGNKEYKVKLAETEEQQEQGLQNIEKLEDNEGMLFIFDEEEYIWFWMQDTTIPLDLIFINEDLKVTQVLQGEPNSEEMLEGRAAYVLEVNQNSGIKVGDELTFNPTDKKINDKKMLVIGPNGEVQMELESGEKIFSRKHTKTLIKFAKKAASTENDNDYKALGKRVFKFLKEQSETAPEYVQSK